MRSLICGLVLMLVAACPAGADLLPPRPPPPPAPPPGPQSAEVRGVRIANQYVDWYGLRWLVRITGCPAGAPACETGCAVTGIAGRAEPVGSVADLVAAEKAAAGAPLELMLVACSSNGLILPAPAAK